jgi:xanthine dehydrogenase iron-sulfur cluster and FAD-binding subunit A
MVNANHRPAPAGILDLWRLAGLCAVTSDSEGVSIGAAATWYEIENHASIVERWTPLALAAREIGALQIQARGTIGGNIGTSSPVGDSLPVLLALGAELELASVRGRRRVAYADFCTGYRKTALAADELIAEVRIPAATPSTRTAWRKVGTRRAQSISKVMGAAAIELDGGVITSARVALGAVADRPIRVSAVEDAVRGLSPGKAADAARAALCKAIKPIDDVRSTATYRLDVAENLVARFFSGILS